MVKEKTINLPAKKRKMAFLGKCGDAKLPVAKGSKIIAKSLKQQRANY